VEQAAAVLHPPMRAAVIQFEAGVDKAANIATAAALIDEAMARQAPTLVSLPEMWTCLGGDRATKLRQAETLNGYDGIPSACQFMAQTARRHGITLHGGSIGELAGGELFNTTLVFGPDGAELGRYRKIHMFDVTTPSGEGYQESRAFGAGTTPVVVDAPEWIRLGLSICYDVRFPEHYLALRRQGAEVMLVPSAFTAETGRDHWEILLRARAIETQSWVIAAATTGRHSDAQGRARLTWGHSLIIDPWGAVHAALGAAPGFAVADIDMAQLARVRAAMPVLQHRRLV
jgi:predicted amidohydrolase